MGKTGHKKWLWSHLTERNNAHSTAYLLQHVGSKSKWTAAIHDAVWSTERPYNIFWWRIIINTMEKFSQQALFCLRVGKKLQDTELVTNHLNRITTDQVTGNLLFDCSHWRTIFTIQNQQQIVFTCSPQLLNHQKFFFIV